MKVGNTINGLTVTDVKRVNKLNLIQFLKEVDNYLQQGYQINVNSARQVGLVLMADMFKTEEASSRVGSTEQIPTESVGVASNEVESLPEGTSVPEEVVATESTVQQDQVLDQVADEAVVEPVVDVVKEEVVVSPKKTTTRSKKTVQ